MTVFVSFASADREAAESLERALERRGQFVELDDGETAMRPIMAPDVLIALISRDFVFSRWRLRHEQRALDAWAAGKLILVKLDHHIAPVGLRDLPSIDASFAAQREFVWIKVADAIRDKLRTGRSEETQEGPEERPSPRLKKPNGRLGSLVLGILLAIPGGVAAAIAASIWLVNRIGPSPGTWTDLIAGVEDFGVRYGVPVGVTPWVFGAAIIITLAVLVFGISRVVLGLFQRRSGPVLAPEPGASAAGDTVFISYARANQAVVLPVVDAAREAGRALWVDQQGGVSAGEGWAGEIVKAIRGAAGVVVMCSKAAFESDHVKREVYLADRYKKRLTPVFIEPAEPPEDFEYFFAGVEALKLFETPAEERSQAFVRVLG